MIVVVCILVLLAIVGVNASYFLLKDGGTRPYRVEVKRIAREIEQYGMEHVDLSDCQYVTGIQAYGEEEEGEGIFFEPDSDYVIREINGSIYRFDYVYYGESGQSYFLIVVNIILGSMALLLIGNMFFIRQKILIPFAQLRDMPYELSKGNLSVPIKENKEHFFGRFAWGINLLRENIEHHKQRELDLQRDKKRIVLSISHDIKTPLSAIKLYAGALSKGLYTDRDKQNEVAVQIGKKADEIEGFVSQIIQASNEDFLDLKVVPGEFYLSELVNNINEYYKEKLDLIQTGFFCGEYRDCLLKGDVERGVEVLQNVMENAIKYGDGNSISLTFTREEKCQLMTVRNSGCTLSEAELPHIFESFWRGSNAAKNTGSGLGLYICRELMHKMDGEIISEIDGDDMCITVVFRKY